MTVADRKTRTVHTVGQVRLGTFSARPGEDHFRAGVIRRTLVAFPRTAVAIRHRRRDELVADPATVMLYNDGDEYERRAIDPVGDRCHWWSNPDDWWCELVADADPEHRLTAASPHAGRIFSASQCSSPGVAWLRQRTLAERVIGGGCDALVVEEELLAVLREVLGRGPVEVSAERRWVPSPTARRRHHRLVEDARELLAARFTEDLSLGEVSCEVGASPFHLSRLFRDHTGRTIHAHRNDLRLRASLDRFGDRDLSSVAADLGFSSHSHFTAAFRRSFGIAPSEVRKILTA